MDDSRSMQVMDGPNGTPRFEAMRQLLRSHEAELARIADAVELRAYTFGRELTPIPLADGQFQLRAAPDQPESALAWAVEEALRREAGRRVVSLVILSDGAQRASDIRDVPLQAVAAQLEQQEIPVFGVLFGEPRGRGRFSDISIDTLRAPATAVVDNEVVLSATLHAEGFQGRQIPVELWAENPEGGQLLDSANVDVTGVSQEFPLKLTFAPKTPGELKLVLRVPHQPGETIAQNNSRATILRVTKGQVRVLVVDSFPPRPELAFLRRALTQGTQLEIDILTLDPRGDASQVAALRHQLTAQDYQALILGNVPGWIVDKNDWETVRRKVIDGVGLLMIGGLWSFGPGGYADTPLGEILPVRMSHLEIQRIDEPPRTDVHIPGPLKVQPTAEGAAHPMLAAPQLGANISAVWNRLPPLDGANKFESLKPAAQVLLETPEHQPILVYQPVGKGRVAALAVDSTWRWALGGYQDFFRHFWRTVVTFLANKEAVREGQVWIDLAERVVRPKAQLNFSVGSNLENEAGEVAFSAQIKETGENIPLQKDAGETSLRGTGLAPETPGDYTIVVEARRGTELVEAAAARFVVIDQEAELENPAADPTVLQLLAGSTGGELVRPEEFSRILDRLVKHTHQLEATLEARQPVWDRWPWLIGVLGLMGLEWFLRRRWGLV